MNRIYYLKENFVSNKEGNGKKINKILKRILNTLGRRKFPEDFLVHLPHSNKLWKSEGLSLRNVFLQSRDSGQCLGIY